MAWQRQEGVVQPSAQDVDRAATSAAWEIIPAADFNAADVSKYSSLGQPTYKRATGPSHTSPPLSSSSALQRRKREEAQAALSRQAVRHEKSLPASSESSRDSALTPLPQDTSASHASLLSSPSNGGEGIHTNTSVSPSTLATSRDSNDTFSHAGPSSRLDANGGVSGLFGTGSSSAKGKRFGMPWRQRLPSSQGTSTDSRTSRDRPSTATTEAEQRNSGQGSSQSLMEAPAALENTATPSSKLRAAEAFGTDSNAFYEHAMSNLHRNEVPTYLSSAGGELHKGALRLYMRRFLFAEDPLDVALRKLLMSLQLPRETQQIDRVMEAFARRYNECNEGIFASDDQPYVLAFSFMMLHTDTFNRNARQKMTKADYIRNTAASSVPAAILDYFYDNITFTEFIHVEDDESTFPGNKRKATASSGDVGSALRSAVSKTRIDAYYIIATGQTRTLRANIPVMIPPKSPFSSLGSRESYDFDALHSAFVFAPCIEIVTSVRPQPSHAAAGAVTSNFATTSPGVLDGEEEKVVTLRVTKISCISRKDDMIDENRKAPSRKWRTCGMILSASQLLFFKDLVWTSALEQQIAEQVKAAGEPEKSVTISPRITYFKPDGVLALTDAVAVKDESSTKYKHVFRLFAKHAELSRQYLIQTASEEEMNDWIHKINFCSTFRSSSIRIRALDPPASSAKLDADSDDEDDDGSSEDQEEVSDAAEDSSADQMGARTQQLRNLDPALRKKLSTRQKEIAPVIANLEKDLADCKKAEEENMHLVRHLSILSPWTKLTRERLELAALPIAVYVRSLRLAIARLTSRRDILRLEMDASERAAVVSPSVTHFDALEFAQQSFWSASSTSLSVSSYTPSTIGGGRRDSQVSNLSSRAPSVLGTRRSAGNLYDTQQLASRFSFSDATGSVFGSGTSTPGDFSDIDAEHDSSEYGPIFQSTPGLRAFGRQYPPVPPHRGSSSSASSALRKHSATIQESAIDGGGTGATPTVQDLNGLPHGSQSRNTRSAKQSAEWSSPLFATAMSSVPSNAIPRSSDSHTNLASPLFDLFSSPSANASLPVQQQQHPREEAEPWNRSRVARGSDKRVSLARLPDSIDWSALGNHRLSLGSTSSQVDTASDADYATPASDSGASDTMRQAMDRLRLHGSLATSSH